MSVTDASNVVEKFLKGRHLLFERQEVGERMAFSCRYAQLCASFDYVPVRIFLEDQALQTFVYFPVRIPEGKRGLVAEYFSRVNFLLKFGRFEIDFRDGEARYQFAQSLGAMNSKEIEEVLSIQLDAPLFAVNVYGDGVLRIVKDNEPPEAALQACAKREQERLGRQ